MIKFIKKEKRMEVFLLAIVVCISMVLCSLRVGASVSEISLYGDVDGNLKVDLSDARQVLEIALNIEKPDEEVLYIADVDGDNQVTLQDALWILRYALNIVTAFLVQSTNQPDEQTGKILVVYFSASGRTENVAKTIASETQADLFEITPQNPYTSEDLTGQTVRAEFAGSMKMKV